RHAGNAAHRLRASSVGDPLTRPESAARANHHGFSRFLAAPLSGSAPRTEPPLSQAQVAGKSWGIDELHVSHLRSVIVVWAIVRLPGSGGCCVSASDL